MTAPQPGKRIVVRTPDRHEYRGWLVEIRERDGKREALVRLDTGWETAFPVQMVEADESS
ncbi:MAG: hypothetical protein ACRDFS_12255 [Chloroflexota bacterium]